MTSNDLLVLLGVPQDYRLGGDAFQKLPQAHPRVRVEVVHDRAEFVSRLADSDAAIASGGYLKVPAEVLSPGGKLRWIQITSAGVDRVMTPELMGAKHIIITSTKGPPGPLIAEHAVLLMLALVRNLPVYLKNQSLHQWRREGQEWLPLHGNTVAILGVGNGGGNLARVCKNGFGMRVLGMSRTNRGNPHVDSYFDRAGLSAALGEADIVVLCLPNTLETANIIDATALSAMKPTAFLINVSRGELIDEPSLIQALQTGSIAGAGLDMTATVPLDEGSPLWDLSNVIITPHIATETIQMSEDVVAFWCENIRRFAEGEPLLGLVDRLAGY